jgi:PfaB family protein
MGNRIAIVGLDVAFADGRGIDSFDRYIYNGETQFCSLPAARKQQLILASEMAGAVSDTVDTASAAWLSTDSCAADELAGSLLEKVALQLNLASKEVELVLLGGDDALAASLQAKVASLRQVSSMSAGLNAVAELVNDSQRVVAFLALELLNAEILNDYPMTDAEDDGKASLHTLIFDQHMQAYQRGEGVGVVLCKSSATATAHGDRIFGFIDSMAAHAVAAQACSAALDAADLEPGDIAYLEMTASDDLEQSNAELSALMQFYRSGAEGEAELSCALGSARTVTGECGVFSAMSGLIKTVMSLYHRYIPGVIGWSEAKSELSESLSWQHSRFYVPTQSRTWYLDAAHSKRFAAYNLVEELDGERLYNHFVLSENDEDKNRPNGYLSEMAMHCFPLADDTEAGLHQQLRELTGIIEQADCIKTAARQCYEKFQQHLKASYALVVLGDEKAELLKEVKLMDSGLAKAFAEKGEWKTPKGSYFTAAPVGNDADVAFVYPGVGAAYVGLGQDLFHMFPQAFNATDNMARNTGSMLKDHTINPRSKKALSFKENKALDLELRRSLATISECGVGYAYVFTNIFNSIFSIKADAALGYSMGEVSMYTAMDCWQDPGALSARLAASPTFNHGLTGDMQTLRKHWDLPPAKEGEGNLVNGEKLWETYSLKGTVEAVSEACEKEDKVYITIVNTPDSIVIGGQPEACERVIASLGVRGMAMEIPSAIHSEPAFKEYENMEKLYTLEVADKVDTKLYSSSCYLPIPQRTKSIANSIAKCFCEQVDFPRLVSTVYNRGARIFMEMGAGRSCCSWIDKILKHEGVEEAHVSIPVNAKGTPDHITITRCLAKLVSHRVEVDLTPLYEGSMLTKK